MPLFTKLLLPFLFLSKFVESDTRILIEQKILNGYNPANPPVVKEDSRIFVGVKWVYDHLSIDEKQSKLKVSARLLLTWDDGLLSWNPRDFNNTNEIVCIRCRIWKPKLRFMNAANGNVHRHRSVTKIISNWPGQGSKIITEIRINGEFGCVFDYSDYPNDINTCTISLKPASFSSKFYLTFNWEIPLVAEREKKLDSIGGGFKLLNTGSSRWFFHSWEDHTDASLAKVTDMEKMFSMHQAHLKFQRDFPLYFAAFKVPAILCAFFNVLSFLLPTLCTTFFFSLATILIQFIFFKEMMEKVPLAMGEPPKCIRIYTIILTCNVISLFINLFLQNITIRTGKNNWITWIRVFFAFVLAISYSIMMVYWF